MAHLLLAVIYASFISLGLPDALPGSAWPALHLELGVPISYAGIISMIITAGTVVSSLMSDRMTYKLGTGKLTAFSVAMTALALLGFSISNSFWMLCLWAVPYGLGAGSVDASLCNYVALHYESRHMSWLHCMWGVGASIGPYIMGFVLSGGQHWTAGYRIVGIIQIALSAFLLSTLKKWKSSRSISEKTTEKGSKPMKLHDAIRIPGAKEVMITFFCYCAVEQTAALWASSYLAIYKGVPAETAAFFASMFFIGIAAGRAMNGFLTIKFSDLQLIRAGQGIILLGIIAMLLPFGKIISLAGLMLVGLGCAPIYPCMLHSTPVHFGAERSQALTGIQMASAYTGTTLMAPLFGLIADHVSLALLPLYLLLCLVIMVAMHERMLKTIREI